MPNTPDFSQIMWDLANIQSTSMRAGMDFAKRKADTRIQGLEYALTDALTRLEGERAWSMELECAIQEAVDNKDLSQLDETNKRITCPKCGDRKERYEEVCPSCDRGDEP